MLYLYFQILFRLIYQPVGYSGNSLSTNYSPLGKELDCDIHLVNLRTMTTGQTSPSDKTALIVHRQGFNACYKPMALTCQTTGGKVENPSFFPATCISLSLTSVDLYLLNFLSLIEINNKQMIYIVIRLYIIIIYDQKMVSSRTRNKYCLIIVSLSD